MEQPISSSPSNSLPWLIRRRGQTVSSAQGLQVAQHRWAVRQFLTPQKVPGNVRLVTLQANIARSDFGDLALLELAEDLCRVGASRTSVGAVSGGPRKPDWRPRKVETPEGGIKVVLWSKQVTPDNKLKRTPPDGERTQITFYGNCEDE